MATRNPLLNEQDRSLRHLLTKVCGAGLAFALFEVYLLSTIPNLLTFCVGVLTIVVTVIALATSYLSRGKVLADDGKTTPVTDLMREHGKFVENFFAVRMAVLLGCLIATTLAVTQAGVFWSNVFVAFSMSVVNTVNTLTIRFSRNINARLNEYVTGYQNPST